MACGKLTTIEEENRYCTPCKTDKKDVESNIYCMDCEAHFCDECFKFHKKVPQLAKHIILKDDDVTIWSKVPYKCKTHDRCYEFFCNDHSRLCCQICISLQHRSCVNIAFIQETGKNEDSGDKIVKLLKQTEDKINATNEKVKDLKRKAELNERSQVNAEECVKGFRSRMNAMLDVLEVQAHETIHQRYNGNKTELDKMEESLNRFVKVLNDLKQQLLSSQNENRATLTFICTELGRQQLNDAKQKLSEMKSSLPRMKFSYILDSSIEEFLQESLTIGCIQDDDVRIVATSSDCIGDVYAGEQNSNNGSSIASVTRSNKKDERQQTQIVSVSPLVRGSRGTRSFAGIVKSPSVESSPTKSKGATSEVKNDVGDIKSDFDGTDEEEGGCVLSDDESWTTNEQGYYNISFKDFSIGGPRNRKDRPRYICSNRFCSFVTNLKYCRECGSLTKEKENRGDEYLDLEDCNC